MLQRWWSKIENNTTVMCFIIYFQFGVWGRPESLHLLWRKLLWQRKWYLRKNWPFLNIEEKEILAFTYDWPFHYQIFHESNRAIWKNLVILNCVLEFWFMTELLEIKPILHQHSTILVMLKYLICLCLL